MKNERAYNGKTILLYETDGMITEFTAVVTGSVDPSDDKGSGIILDRTAFFPGGGGQDADTGYFVLPQGNRIRVTGAGVIDGEVVHYAETTIPAGSRVTGVIDRKQRLRRMQDHGAEHLISGLVHERFGYDNVGFHMSEDETVIDFNGPLTDDEIRDIEKRANEIILDNVPITVNFPTPGEAEALDYRSKLDLCENVRLVVIEGADVCACCAPHMPSTGLLGSVKIISSMPHRGGTRMSLIAGMNAYEDHAKLCESNSRIMELLSSPRYSTAEFVKDLTGRMSALKEENALLRRKLTENVAETIVKELAEADERDRSIRVFFTDGLDMTSLRELVNRCTKVYGGTVCAFLMQDGGFGYNFSVCPENAESAHLRDLANDFNLKCMGRGGGSPVMVTGTTSAGRDAIEDYFASKTP